MIVYEYAGLDMVILCALYMISLSVKGIYDRAAASTFLLACSILVHVSQCFLCTTLFSFLGLS